MTRQFVTSVLHPADFSKEDEKALAHAVRIAHAAKAELTILHVAAPKESVLWSDFPDVRSTLARWNLRSSGAGQDAMSKISFQIKKVTRNAHQPAQAIVEYVVKHNPDLVVLATHQRKGFSRWMHRAIAEPIARDTHVMTLFVPRRVRGFVSKERGTVSLKNIVIPVDFSPHPQRAVDTAVGLARALACSPLHITVFHVGEKGQMPDVTVAHAPGWTDEKTTWPGAVVEEILAISEEKNADLIVMATQGHKGFLDALRGSTTERVLRGARCPVLAVPAG